MGDPFKKVQPGDRLEIPAAAYNAFIDAALAHRASTREGPPSLRTHYKVLVRNNTGADLEQFATVGLGDAVITPAQNESAFKQQVLINAEVPVESKHQARFGVLTAPLKAGAISDRVVISGPNGT